MDKSQLKTVGIIFLIIISLSVGLIFALTGAPENPVNNFEDNDGRLDLGASCVPTSQAGSNYDGTTSYNITNATLYSNVDGTWKSNATIQVSSAIANVTYFFNFTNHINVTNEGSFQWSVQCIETNATGTKVNTAFTENRTIKVKYTEVDLEATSPADNIYDLDGSNIELQCTGSAASGWNLTKAEVMVRKGNEGYSSNQSHYPVLSNTASIPLVFNATIGNYTDGTDITWSCRYTQIQNRTDIGGNTTITELTSTSNRTINIEYPPDIALTYPADSSWQGGVSSTLNFSVTSTFTTSTLFTCQLFTNETNTWNVKSTIGTTTNNTNKSISYQFPELTDIRWGVYCQENADANVYNWSVNRTIKADRTSPVVSITHLNQSSVVNRTYFKTNELILNYSLTETNKDTCISYINSSVNVTDITPDTNFTVIASDGVYNVVIGCNDSANNWKNSSTFQFILDTIPPQINTVRNFSIVNTSDKRLINFSSNEDINLTLFYGTTTAVTSIFSNSTFATINQNGSINNQVVLNNLEENKIYYFNITACDRAGNCNTSGTTMGQFDFRFPFKLKAGWSYYGIYDGRINFSDILTDSGAEYVYYWNQTDQQWIFATAGGTSNMGFEVGSSVGDHGNRHVIALYEEINSTWVRNVSNYNNSANSISYKFNLTAGHNFLKMYDSRTMGKLAESMLNESILESGYTGMRFGLELVSTGNKSSNVAPLTYNMTQFFFAAFNNSANDWTISYTYNFTKNNATTISNISISEVAWIFSPRNLTWNGTNIMYNWTI